MGSHGRPGVRPGKKLLTRMSSLKTKKVWMDDLHKHRTLERTFICLCVSRLPNVQVLYHNLFRYLIYFCIMSDVVSSFSLAWLV